VYQYFPNKDAILVALVRRHIAEGTAALSPLIARLQTGDPIEEVMVDVVKAMVSLHASAPRLHRVLFEETPLPSSLRSELHAMEDALAGVVSASLRMVSERRGDRDLDLAARVLIAIVEGLTHQLILRPPKNASPDIIAAEITTLVGLYLRDLAPARVRALSRARG
jgi:AcrR family transcriptional regulator